MLRTKTNLAWFLRGIAKQLRNWADRLEPIKINTPSKPATKPGKEPRFFDWFTK